MLDAAVAEVDAEPADKRTSKYKAWAARQANAETPTTETTITPSAPPEAPPAPAPQAAPATGPALLSIEEFMLRFFCSNIGYCVTTVAGNELDEAGGALAGLAVKCYRAYCISTRIAYAAVAGK